MFSSCANFAQRGISEEKWTPGIEVGMLGKGPLLGRPGLGSHVSNWLGPPHKNSRITFFCARRTVWANNGLVNNPWKLVTAVAPPATRPLRNRRRCNRCSSGTQQPGRDWAQIELLMPCQCDPAAGSIE